jgi:heat shock protein HslJ
MKKTFFILALATIIVSCNNTNTKSNTEQADTTVTSSTQPITANADLFGTEWKLLELNGKTIKLDTTFKKEPVLVFEKGTEKLNGNGGCNGFMGSYKIKENNGIELTLGGATMMACPNLELENQFHDVLKQTKSYHIEGNTLLLNNNAKTTIAKLEASAK